MTVFRVWAPEAQRVDLVLGADGRRLAMAGTGRGWWQLDHPQAGSGTKYGFSIDGGPARPDPRSPWQPEGIDGRSAVVDQREFAWSDQGWRGAPLAGALLYELHVGTFTAEGTFDAVIRHLDHLIELGVTVIELMPVAEFSGDHGWGYDGVLLYAPHHAYGGPAGLKRLVDACHSRGLGVALDVVYNHLGPAGNYLGEYGPYFTDRYKTPWGDAINFDGPNSDEVRRFFVDNALMWLRDYHFDGLRLDAVHAIVDTGAVHILEQLAVEVEALGAHVGRTLWLVAESDQNDPRLVAERGAGGYGMDAQWSDDFHHALHAVLTGETSGYYEDFGDLAQLAYSLGHAYVYDGRYSRHRRRRHGRSIAGLPGGRFLGYSQNHDQIGNRATGERLVALTSEGRLRVAAALELCAPFVPMLFQGEEWGASTPFQYFTDHSDPALGEAVRNGRRREFAPFGWKPEDVPDPQDPETWRRSVLRWEELDEPSHAALLGWYRRLIALRRAEPSLSDGRLDNVDVRYDDDRQWLTMRRGPVQVVCNLSAGRQSVPVERPGLMVLSSDTSASLSEGAVDLDPDAVAVLRSPDD
jgi:maltooligosyltrehalose trehalohydrolase